MSTLVVSAVGMAVVPAAPDTWRPKRRQRGMIEMKRLTVELDPVYARELQSVFHGRRAWLGYLYELFNFSDGERTLRQIARALSHEVGQIDVGVLARMARDLERMGYLSVQDAS